MNGFGPRALLAAGLAIAGAVSFTGLSLLLPTGVALRGVITAVAAAYALHTLAGGARGGGRLVLGSAWLLGALVLWQAPLTLVGFVLGHALGLWGLRSLAGPRRLLAMATDLGLTGLAVAAAAWAAIHTGSLLLALWSFGLVLACAAGLPGAAPPREDTGEDAFQRAHRTAEAALRRLSTP